MTAKFESRLFHMAKDPSYAHEYEDAFCVDPERGRAAIADGVSSAIFSRHWAEILTHTTVERPPDLYDDESLQAWLTDGRRAWIERIDLPNLRWNQRQKLQQVGGAYSTLLWVEVSRCFGNGQDEDGGTAERPNDVFRFRSFALGDCNLFHIRGGKILRSFPMETAADFELDPLSICSVDLRRDHELEFQQCDDDCRAGDLLVLCSDAVGKWALTRIEADDPPDWETYWDMPSGAWTNEIAALRQERQMRYDDTTLLLLRVGVQESDDTALPMPVSIDQVWAADEPIADDRIRGASVSHDQIGADPVAEALISEAATSDDPIRKASRTDIAIRGAAADDDESAVLASGEAREPFGGDCSGTDAAPDVEDVEDVGTRQANGDEDAEDAR